MSRTRTLVTIAAFVAAALVVAACGGDDGGGGDAGTSVAADATELFVVSPYLSTFPETRQLVDAFVAEATGAGYQVNPPVDTQGDLARVGAEIQTAVTSGVDAVVIGQGDPSQMTAGLEAARAAGVPVFGLDVGSVEGITANITSDNASLGDIGAQAMAARIGEGGKVVIIHFDGFEPLRQRAEAARKRFEASGIQVLENLEGSLQDPTNAAKAIALERLAALPVNELNGIWAAWDAAGLGAYEATVEAARPDVFVTSVDGQPIALGPVGEGTNWIATVRQDWENVATTAVDTIDKFYDRTAIEQTILVPGKLVTKDNAGS
jgi:ribose transport system substrate-binding protein